MDQLFEDTALIISSAELFRENPKLKQKAHREVSALQPHRREELYLAGTGASRTEGAINEQMTHIILDGLPNVCIAPSDITFIMADGSKKFCLGIAKGLNLWIGGAEITIDTAIFNYHKYTCLLGRKTMTDMGITTQYLVNKWVIKYNN
ncbi:hypothetical protein DSO57_1026537 [Entomophthora muscae]|uniref:Uncharacterized protein n=1 Tax=Entomophthora muscae TaxID=34485 RepID=A0ACC2T2C1_9FUNG|nr:hypothetical protein DSO57_1026537 [Entomophthora muscae]